MASINGWIFIIIGAGIAAVVYFFIPDLWVFIYVGGAFFAYGLIKLLFKTTVNKFKNKKHKSISHHSHSPQHTTGHKTYRPGQQQHPHYVHQPHTAQNRQQQNTPHIQSTHQRASPHKANQPHIVFCRKCGNKLGVHHNFCSHCGMKQS